MITEMKRRKYTLGRRARARDATRDRIVDATVALHEELGPHRTTVTAIAERAGVQRLTVYRHFPEEAGLFEACTSRWLAANPPPDPTAWIHLSDPALRTRTALEAYFRYYRRTARMWRVAYRDLELVPALQAPMARFDASLATLRDELALAWHPASTAHEAIRSVLGHALRFSTWDSLEGEGGDEAKAAAWFVAWLRALAQDEGPVPSEPGERRTV